jgi:hypothetical protein
LQCSNRLLALEIRSIIFIRGMRDPDVEQKFWVPDWCLRGLVLPPNGTSWSSRLVPSGASTAT